MEIYPEEMDSTLHDVKCTVNFFGYTSIHRKIITVIPYDFMKNTS